MSTVDQHADARRTRRLTTVIEYADGTAHIVVDPTDRRDTFAAFLRDYFDGDIAIAAAPDEYLPHDPATLVRLGINAAEYAGTAHAIAQLVGFDPHDGAMILDVVAAALEVAR
ncbi:hypothetical protein FK529_04640 [Tsukamurella asaccharolytica]|uniref:Uncharacterized protein n=1 Tax=Tsukamurella asaccharolytica TaxID=2592067 RepID=A0A5C5RDK1_9ACTN|nr:hypothetical protein [Tsukamurella asaccharolytica]TWS20634.1 hypothetical protein FK529_04640 [Tsukamurella asaccharolytica]